MRKFIIKNRQKRKYTKKQGIQSTSNTTKTIVTSFVPPLVIIGATVSLYILIQSNILLKLSLPRLPQLYVPKLHMEFLKNTLLQAEYLTSQEWKKIPVPQVTIAFSFPTIPLQSLGNLLATTIAIWYETGKASLINFLQYLDPRPTITQEGILISDATHMLLEQISINIQAIVQTVKVVLSELMLAVMRVVQNSFVFVTTMLSAQIAVETKTADDITNFFQQLTITIIYTIILTIMTLLGDIFLLLQWAGNKCVSGLLFIIHAIASPFVRVNNDLQMYQPVIKILTKGYEKPITDFVHNTNALVKNIFQFTKKE